MKILIPIIGFDRTGGYRVLSELSNTWIKQGHDVAFLCIDNSKEPYFPTTANIIRINKHGAPSKIKYDIKKSSRWQLIKSLYLGLKSIGDDYDVILANHSLTAWPVALSSCKRAKKIYYIQAYEPGYYAGTRKIKGYLFAIGSALTYHLPLNRIVNAPLYFRYKNLKASVFVPPGIDLSNFKPSVLTKDIANADTIVIGCIGRSELEKGTIYVLRAFEELYKKDSRFFLRIAAFGDLPEGWKHDRCQLIVPKNDAELADYYRSLDILVAPGTVQHGAPHYPVLEAAACGISVVTTGYMGASKETAWLVQNKDVDSIVEAVLEISKNTEIRNDKKNKFIAHMKDYSWDIIANRMIKAFNLQNKT